MLTKLAEKLVAEEMTKVAVAKWKEQLAGLSPESRASLAVIAKSENREIARIHKGTFRIIREAGFKPRLVTEKSSKDEKDLLKASGGYCAVTNPSRPLYGHVLLQRHRAKDVVPYFEVVDGSQSPDMAHALGLRHEAYEALEAARLAKKRIFMQSDFYNQAYTRVGKHTSPRVLALEAKLRNQTYHADKATGVDKAHKDSGIAAFLAESTGRLAPGQNIYETALTKKDYARMSDPKGYFQKHPLPLRGKPEVTCILREYEVPK